MNHCYCKKENWTNREWTKNNEYNAEKWALFGQLSFKLYNLLKSLFRAILNSFGSISLNTQIYYPKLASPPIYSIECFLGYEYKMYK
jgi:hypothetical protein